MSFTSPLLPSTTSSSQNSFPKPFLKKRLSKTAQNGNLRSDRSGSRRRCAAPLRRVERTVSALRATSQNQLTLAQNQNPCAISRPHSDLSGVQIDARSTFQGRTDTGELFFTRTTTSRRQLQGDDHAMSGPPSTQQRHPGRSRFGTYPERSDPRR